MSASDEYTIDDARNYGFGLLELYKLWHWNNCIPHAPWHDEMDEKMRATQRELDDRYQLLPVDADGEVIHIGDKMDLSENVRGLTVIGVGTPSVNDGETGVFVRDASCYTWFNARLLRHHKPTMKDVLWDFLHAADDAMRRGYEEPPSEVFDEFIAKLKEVQECE